MWNLKNLCFAASLIFISCNGSRYLSSKVKANEITELEVFKPVSFIALIEKANKGDINDSISFGLEKIITKELFDSTFLLQKLNPIIIKEENTERQLVYETIKLNMAISEDYKIKSFTLPPRINMVLKSRGKRFGLIVFSNGFTRTNANFKTEVKDGILKSVMETVVFSALGSGPFISINVNAGSRITLSAMIVDAEKNNVAFYNESSFTSLNVLDHNLIKKEIRKLVGKYFKKQNIKNTALQ